MPAQPKPKKVGRPALPKGEAKAETLRIRVTPSELRGYGAMAKDSKQSVSEWIRGTLNAAMEAEHGIR
jgi:predicted HicB family RNase H-like nuclease